MGVSSQGGALQLLDAHDRPQGRVISWMDLRGQAYDAAFTAEVGRDYLARHIGHGGSGLTIGQMLRIRQEARKRLQSSTRVGFVGDVIVGRLCGRRAHDATSLGIAMLYNPWLGRSDPELMGRLGLCDEQLPCLLPATMAAGTLHESTAEVLGLPPGIPVSPAIHDQYAASLGAASVEEGDVSFGAGTAWVLLANAGALRPPVVNEAYVCQHPVDNLYGQMLSMRNGGSAIQWALCLLGTSGATTDQIDTMLEAVPPGSDGLRCWPFLSGGPQGNEFGCRNGRLFGITLAHGPNHVVRAVVEGLACELRRHIGMLTDAGLAVRRLIMCGTAAAGHNTPQIIADVTGLPVHCVEISDVSALGAAMLARRLLNTDTDLAAIARHWAPSRRTMCPGQCASTYHGLFQDYLGGLGGNESQGAT